jgi:hypothetical protein
VKATGAYLPNVMLGKMMTDPQPWVRRWSDGDTYGFDHGKTPRYARRGRDTVHLRYVYDPRPNHGRTSDE